MFGVDMTFESLDGSSVVQTGGRDCYCISILEEECLPEHDAMDARFPRSSK